MRRYDVRDDRRARIRHLLLWAEGWVTAADNRLFRRGARRYSHRYAVARRLSGAVAMGAFDCMTVYPTCACPARDPAGDAASPSPASAPSSFGGTRQDPPARDATPGIRTKMPCATPSSKPRRARSHEVAELRQGHWRARSCRSRSRAAFPK